MSNVVWEAMQFAIKSHEGQVRMKKGGWGRPEAFINHVSRVALQTSIHLNDPMYTAIAWLHDTVEDCENVHESDIVSKFGVDIAKGVMGLSNTSNLQTKYNTWVGGKPYREKRKELDRIKIASLTDNNLKTIKTIDRIDNIRSSIMLIDMQYGLISEKNVEFCETYSRETRELIHALAGAKESLVVELIGANNVLKAACNAFRTVKNYFGKKDTLL